MVYDRPICEADRDDAAETHDHVCTAVRYDTMLKVGDDPLLPQARDHTAPRKRRRPLAIDVRSVQDIYQSATLFVADHDFVERSAAR